MSCYEQDLRLSDEEFKARYEQAFRSWIRLHQRIVENDNAPDYTLLFQEVLRGHPVLPHTLRLEPNKDGAFAIGSSLWGSTRAVCTSDLPQFQQPIRLRVASKQPTMLAIQQDNEAQESFASFFGQREDFMSILVLAWTYVLSARWVETMSGGCKLLYTDTLATRDDGFDGKKKERNIVNVQLNDAGAEEARWWAAILAPGQGWHATMNLPSETYISPWSICTQSSCEFQLSCTTVHLPPYAPAASFLDARRYLHKFCVDHSISDQSHAALAAVLLLPSLESSHIFKLAIPKDTASKDSFRGTRHSNQYDWIYEDRHIDKLITLSCNSKGMRPMLMSVFYEPDIECNAVSPWLQGTIAALTSIGNLTSHSTVRLCMSRAPTIAVLWLGSYIVGCHKKFLNEGLRYGQLPIELHSAAWSGLLQSFVQLPTSNPLMRDGAVSREDECRLLFLSQSSDHTRLPLCQWKPFGVTPIDYTDIEVRKHKMCQGHQLLCEKISWECEGDRDDVQILLQNTTKHEMHGDVQTDGRHDKDFIPVRFAELNREREGISENATRNMFGWLRPDGCAPHELKIWKHEWMYASSSSDEDDTDLDESLYISSR